MKQVKFNGKKWLLVAPVALVTGFVMMCSFTASTIANDFLKELGISKQDADGKITNGILGGYLDYAGMKNLKSIALGDRKAITLDLLSYVSTPAFIKQYAASREPYKPVEHIAETPENFQASEIENKKKTVAFCEKMVASATPATKKMYEQNLADAQKDLKEAQDPNYKYYVNYKKNYADEVKEFHDSYVRGLADWNAKYPENQMLFVKKRLQEFLDATRDIDYGAALTDKNGKKIFVNTTYEHKPKNWKMAFRAGKEVTEAARTFVQAWVAEIK